MSSMVSATHLRILSDYWSKKHVQNKEVCSLVPNPLIKWTAFLYLDRFFYITPIQLPLSEEPFSDVGSAPSTKVLSLDQVLFSRKELQYPIHWIPLNQEASCIGPIHTSSKI